MSPSVNNRENNTYIKLHKWYKLIKTVYNATRFISISENRDLACQIFSFCTHQYIQVHITLTSMIHTSTTYNQPLLRPLMLGIFLPQTIHSHCYAISIINSLPLSDSYPYISSIPTISNMRPIDSNTLPSTYYVTHYTDSTIRYDSIKLHILCVT